MGSPSPSSPTPTHFQLSTGVSLPTSSFSPRCQHKIGARNLVVCIDGTSNQQGENRTNVVKLYADLPNEPRMQRVYYLKGIGTSSSRIKKAVTDTVDVAIALNVDENVKSAYEWLAWVYEKGDRIFLFGKLGFSRGAYQVQLLAAMIHKVGLIKEVTKNQVGTAYDRYKDTQSGRAVEREIAREFKKTFSWEDLSVHFVGVWDTVSSVGLVKEDVIISAHARHFRHALALDERRVKFMPEYIHEMNCVGNDGMFKYTPGEQNTTIDVKEVWFAGCHSDVGGKNRPGILHQAGNVSLLWMRGEAAEHGLLLKPTEVVWVPDDLDFGVSDSMNLGWRAMEYLPIRHQVSYSGTGKHKLRLHRAQPRRILPGQKVHTSILYSNVYHPQATLGEGFDMPIIQPGLEHTVLDDPIWEARPFDDEAVLELEQLLGRLVGREGVALEPLHLDRLLFMLRFKEGKEHARSMCGLKDKLMKLITEHCHPVLNKLVAMVAYCEVFCDSSAHAKCVLRHDELPKAAFNDGRKALKTVLPIRKNPNDPRVVALLAPLTRHQILRQELLTEEVLDVMVGLLDKTVENIKQSSKNVGQVIHGLTYLLRFEETREIIINKLAAPYPGSTKSRLSRIMDVDGSHILTPAVLCMTLTLARLPEAKTLCTEVRPRLRELATKYVGPVGSLAFEILLVLYDQSEEHQLDVSNANVQVNLSNVLVRLSIQLARDSSADSQVLLPSPSVRLKDDDRDPGDESSRSEDPRQRTLCQLFGLDASTLNKQQKEFISKLKSAVQNGTTRERTASTMTILKLVESKVIRTYLREMKLLDVFIEQLKREDSALLAAYALAICLRYGDMMNTIWDNEQLPKNIFDMLREDYFDDAVGRVEGFEILRNLMKHEELRKKLEEQPIADILEKKLGGGKPKEIRTSLICLDILHSANEEGSWCNTLVKNSLKHLRKSKWGEQKTGIRILSVLAQTKYGVKAIGPHIIEIVEMLLPPNYRLYKTSTESADLRSPTSQTEPHIAESGDPELPASSNVVLKARIAMKLSPIKQVFSQKSTAASDESEELWPRSLPWIMGLASALRVLVRSKELRVQLRQSLQYGRLKDLYFSGDLAYLRDISPLRINTPNRMDILDMLDELIKIVDEDPAEEGFKSIEDAGLPYIQHFNRLGTLLANRTLTTLTILSAVLGVSTFGIPALLVAVPVYYVPRVSKFPKWMLGRIRPDSLENDAHDGPAGGAEGMIVMNPE